MQFFDVAKMIYTQLKDLGEREQRAADAKSNARRQEFNESLVEYRSRGIYVLAVYFDGTFWQYFYYPSAEKRREAAMDTWPRHFGNIGVDNYLECRYIDPE